MKLVQSITIIFLTFISYSQDSLNSDLKKRIYNTYLLDQECRDLMTKYKNHELDTNLYRLSDLEKKITVTDSLNYFELKAIIKEYGFPGFDKVGEDFSNSFWNIIQHQDKNHEFQKEVLEKMKIEVNKNNASGTYYAYLVDRVKINAGEKQIYGTQMQLNSDSTSYEVKLTIDIENLNKRRLEMNLIPIEEYIEMMNSRFFGTLKKK